MIKRGIVKGKLRVNSAEARLNGSCPLMPEEVMQTGPNFSVSVNWSENDCSSFSN